MYKTLQRFFLVFAKWYEFEFNVTSRNFLHKILNWTFITNTHEF